MNICVKCKKNEGTNVLVKEKNKFICYQCTKEIYQKRKEYIKKYHADNIEKIRKYKLKYSRTKRKLVSKIQDSARGKLRRAIEKGLLKRGVCSICGKENAQAHHEDYSKPLDVMWFCPKHHREHEEKNGMRIKKYQIKVINS